jgi:glycerol-3-phosphate dehydrogenase
MAVNLSDIVFRRSDLGSAQCPAKGLLKKICTLMAKELHWDQQEQTRQLEQVYAAYAPLSPQHN